MDGARATRYIPDGKRGMKWGTEVANERQGNRSELGGLRGGRGVDVLPACRYPWKFNHAVPL